MMKAVFQTNLKYIFKAVLFCVVFIVLFILFSFAKNFIPPDFERLAHGILGTLAAILTTLLFLKFDKKKFSDIGLHFKRSTIPNFFIGVVIGVLIMGLLVAGVMYFSHTSVKINPNSNILRFVVMTLPLIPLAFMEELGFRAYPLEILKSKVDARNAIIITSILFALYHVANGWPVSISFLGPGIWGLIFGLAAIYSRGIAMPTGIHYAINLTTSAFGENDNTTSIWIINKAKTSVLDQHRIDWITLLPAISLFILATILFEIYNRQKIVSKVGS